MMTILNDLLSLFFPRLCMLCKLPLTKGEEHICLHCLCHLPYTRFSDNENNPVSFLFRGKVAINKASALLYYEKGGHVQRLIHSLKYYDNKELAFYMGRMAALYLQKNGLFESVDVLIPVPLHPDKQRKRGYNQSEWIAKGIHSVLNIPVDTLSVRRLKKTETQTNKMIYERWKNVQDIFSLVQDKEIQGKHVLLIDDVITTGSTLGSCAEKLLTISRIKVSILSLAITHS
ncbi:ComF family protein [Parabacteroides sp. AM08-6]|uniref:ComF family protein n=1 Tax=Parabacteroides sp. AM08-6 TaxID=2292053 RepID=UPI000F007ED8|nr:ComF family protein [Parabacteroides sp. AM08-6]RHJ86521.1 ComF family protein [Parabacteroides sp. AM08-6]